MHSLAQHFTLRVHSFLAKGGKELLNVNNVQTQIFLEAIETAIDHGAKIDVSEIAFLLYMANFEIVKLQEGWN